MEYCASNNLMKFKQGKSSLLHLRCSEPYTRIGWEFADSAGKAWGSWWTSSWKWVNSVPSQRQSSTASQLTLAKAKPADWETSLFPSASHWRGCIWRLVSSFESFQCRRDIINWSKSGRDHQNGQDLEYMDYEERSWKNLSFLGMQNSLFPVINPPFSRGKQQLDSPPTHTSFSSPSWPCPTPSTPSCTSHVYPSWLHLPCLWELPVLQFVNVTLGQRSGH